jgi:hypothetical protein
MSAVALCLPVSLPFSPALSFVLAALLPSARPACRAAGTWAPQPASLDRHAGGESALARTARTRTHSELRLCTMHVSFFAPSSCVVPVGLPRAAMTVAAAAQDETEATRRATPAVQQKQHQMEDFPVPTSACWLARAVRLMHPSDRRASRSCSSRCFNERSRIVLICRLLASKTHELNVK